MNLLSLGFLGPAEGPGELVGLVGDMSHPLSPDLHNPLSFIIVMLSLAGNLCRQDEDDSVDLGNKNSSFWSWTFLLSPEWIFPSQTHIFIHVGVCVCVWGGTGGLGLSWVKQVHAVVSLSLLL